MCFLEWKLVMLVVLRFSFVVGGVDLLLFWLVVGGCV